MFGGIDAETVDTVVAYPLAEPVGEIIAWCISGDFFGVGVRFMAIEIGQTGRRVGFGFEIR
ncbi:hypothetical protein D3C86_1413720 [compost metagenome]